MSGKGAGHPIKTGHAIEQDRPDVLRQRQRWFDNERYKEQVLASLAFGSPEFRDRAVRMVDEHRGDYPSEWAAMTSIAGKVGCTTETLRRWCREEASRRAGPAAQAVSERDRVKALEREVKELRRANEILRKASAYFAQAELDRHGKW